MANDSLINIERTAFGKNLMLNILSEIRRRSLFIQDNIWLFKVFIFHVYSCAGVFSRIFRNSLGFFW